AGQWVFGGVVVGIILAGDAWFFRRIGRTLVMVVVSRVRVDGPLQEFAAGFSVALESVGYAPLSAANQLRLMAHLSRWMAFEGVAPSELNDELVQAFLSVRSARGYVGWLSARGLAPLLGHLRAVGAAPAPVPRVPSGPVEELLTEYRAYLFCERGLVAATVRYYAQEARLFLTRSGSGELRELTAGTVTRFVVAEASVRSTGAAKLMVTALRSLLRFLLLTGRVETDLVSAVPAVAGWRLAWLPRSVRPDQVRVLLESCEQNRLVGRRDFAILTVLTRLGLRAGEVAAMELDDIDWRAGELVIRGKGNQHDKLPLPVDVGQALVGYLRAGRPTSSYRQVFLTALAPHQPLASGSVCAVVGRACVRAGIERIGAHRLRHTTATSVLQAGASLEEVGQLLRHRELNSTAIYAKVDHGRLVSVTRPWPSGSPS
ncbi:site-specific integrase, partial [Mycolicibacterium brumae]